MVCPVLSAAGPVEGFAVEGDVAADDVAAVEFLSLPHPTDATTRQAATATATDRRILSATGMSTLNGPF